MTWMKNLNSEQKALHFSFSNYGFKSSFLNGAAVKCLIFSQEITYLTPNNTKIIKTNANKTSLPCQSEHSGHLQSYSSSIPLIF